MDKVYGPFDHLSDTQLNQIMSLWNGAYPVGICYEDLNAFKTFLQPLNKIKHYLYLSIDNDIIGWIMTFDRKGERWFSIIISDEQKRQGLGEKLINHVHAREPVLNGWVVDHPNDVKKDGSPYESPLGFYLKLGFEVIKEERYEKPGISCVKVVSASS